MVTALDRFEAKVEKLEKGCWRWTASLFDTGYGQFRWSPAKNGYAHIWAYEHFIGPAPAGGHLDHLCRNRWCVNPWHLEPVTETENILRGEGAAARNARKTHCDRGHELAGDNLYIARGRRYCRACRRDDAAARRAADRERARLIDKRYRERKAGREPPSLPTR